jgi:alpha-beta hydrolase superfamily lysophospholipase
VSEGSRSPLAALGALASQEVEVTDGLRHVEIYTLGGLLTLLWHGDPESDRLVLACGGAMGGLLGPAEGVYHDLGVRFAEQGVGLVRVGYRKPNDVGACVHDLVAVAELGARRGAKQFVTMGHSFGGAVAVRAAIVLGDDAVGVVTLATQSAGCEDAERLSATPVLLFHGENDELLPPQASELVQMLTGGELVVFPDTGHLLTQAADELRDRLGRWIPQRFA